MTEDYTIENLENIFFNHSQVELKERKERLERYKTDYPDSEVPPHLYKDFSISEALHVICREINLLKQIQDDQDCNENINIIEEIIKNAGISEDLLGIRKILSNLPID